MRIGVVKEIKDRENRVALTPAGALDLVEAGHEVIVEENAGIGSGFSNDEYRKNGANIVPTERAWDTDLILKVKEPQETEYGYLHDNILFTYLHLAGVPDTLTKALIKARTTAIAYETVENKAGRFPLLAPMSAIAGNMAAQFGAWYLARFNGGKGIQLGRMLTRRHGKAMVIGDGTVGQHAAMTADGMGADVLLFGRNRNKFLELKKNELNDISFVESNNENIAEHVKNVDLLIGAVLQPGDRAPHVVSEEMVSTMQAGSVIVDVSIDQGGCIETSRPTTHSDPVFTCHDVIHYCVTNMPGAYPRTATIALTEQTLPYIHKLANNGLHCLEKDPGFVRGVNVYQGFITCEPVAKALGLESQYKPFAIGEPA